jgi:hypothetical protein
MTPKSLLRVGIFAAFLSAAVAACTSDPAGRNQPAPAARLITIELTAAEALAWPWRNEWRADLDGDDRPETIILTADVEMAGNGRALWEDGHRWAVLITAGSETTLAYAAFVPRGFVEVAVLEPSSEHRRSLLLNERTPEQLRTITIAYDGTGQVEATSAAYYQIESWLPGSAALPVE